MRRFCCLVSIASACILLPIVGGAQSQTCRSVASGGVQVGSCTSATPANRALAGLPRNVQLPNGDFSWYWGTRSVDDNPDPHDFSISGTEDKFVCRLTGSFQADFPRGVTDPSAWVRDFVAALAVADHFIRDATSELNRIFRDGSDSSWATLLCRIPDELPTDEVLEDRANKALERARQERERRRE